MAAVTVVILAMPYLPPVRTAVLTVALLPEMVDLPLRPLSTLPRPARTTTTYGAPADRLDIYVPAGARTDRSLPAVLLALGVHPQPIDHPDVVDLATAISRVGVVVGVPDSTALRELRVTPAEPAHLADAAIALAAIPEVDASHVGFAGFSAGASIALIAAVDERIAGDVAFVSAFGGYANAELLLIDVATRSVDFAGTVHAWQPDVGIRRDVLELTVGTLASVQQRDDLRARLQPVVSSDVPPNGPRPEDLAELEGDARAIYLLFTARDRPTASAAIDAMSTELRAQLAGISPTTFADQIRAPVYLLHGEPDTAIPVSHAGLLARSIGPEVRRATVFGRFGHGQPGQAGLGIDDAGDVWELTLYLRDIVAAATE